MWTINLAKGEAVQGLWIFKFEPAAHGLAIKFDGDKSLRKQEDFIADLKEKKVEALSAFQAELEKAQENEY